MSLYLIGTPKIFIYDCCIRMFGSFGGAECPVKTAVMPFPAMKNMDPLVIVVSAGE